MDLADNALMSQMYAVVVAVRCFERPHFVPAPEAAAVADLRHLDPGESTHLWGMWEEGTLAGVLTAWLPLHDNVDTVWTQVDIHPDHRRRGHGTRAIAALVESEQYLCFGPDTLAEARNRGYRLVSQISS